MTKEEYEKLLKSDYWKGFSYSLIKERNFTCEDCGRQFYNQRNKLEVHHLVYRDINPWSYRPEEMIVLCEECHKKRHGLYSEPKTDNHDHSSIDPYYVEPQKKPKWKYIYYGVMFLLLFILLFGWDKISNKSSKNSEVIIVEPTDQPSETKTNNVKSSTSKTIETKKEITTNNNANRNTNNETPQKIDITTPSATTNNQDKTTVQTNSTATGKTQNTITSQKESSTNETPEKSNIANTIKETKPSTNDDEIDYFLIDDSDDIEEMYPYILIDDSDDREGMYQEPYTIVDEMPSYPGGDAALMQYIMSNIVYPESARKNNIQGRVFVQFCVTPTGDIDMVRITRGVDPAIDAEAVRVVKTIKGFRPGKQGGVAVPVWYQLSINFQL